MFTFSPGSSVEPLISALPTAASHMETLELLGDRLKVGTFYLKKLEINEWNILSDLAVKFVNLWRKLVMLRQGELEKIELSDELS